MEILLILFPLRFWEDGSGQGRCAVFREQRDVVEPANEFRHARKILFIAQEVHSLGLR